MLAPRLTPGGRVGIICPSHIASTARYELITRTLEGLGFGVKLGGNIYRDTHGYLASPEERAADFNAMVADDEVALILFGGGWGAAELLPHIDFDAVRRHPKLLSSYSDGTTILNAVYAQTGLVTYCGQGTGEFERWRADNYAHFTAHFLAGHQPAALRGEGGWQTLRGGCADGILLGGYLLNMALLPGSPYFRYDAGARYLLFLEDHETFNSPAAVSTLLSNLEQTGFFRQVSGLIFGHYAADVPPALSARLERLGSAHGIPVVYTDDFGHGDRHAILPVGMRAALDADAQTLRFAEQAAY